MSSSAQPSLFDALGEQAQEPVAVTGRAAVARVMLEETSLELDYAIPEELADRVQLGSRVHVPLQGRREHAVVIQLDPEGAYSGKMKPIFETIGKKAVFSENLLRLAHWVASYYLAPLRLVLRSMLPEAVRSKPESFLSDSHLSLVQTLDEAAMGKLHKSAPVQARIIELMQAAGGDITLSELRKELPRAVTSVHVMVKRNMITRSEIRVERDPFEEDEFLPSSPLTLTEEQSTAFRRCSRHWRRALNQSPSCCTESQVVARPRSICRRSHTCWKKVRLRWCWCPRLA